MFNKIKSNQITKKSFYYLKEKKKLKILKYNKNLQKKLNLDIFDYRRFTGKIIIYDENGEGKGKEFLGNQKIFVGNFLNGERIGKGKEYDDSGDLIYDGEYLKGERNGHGKEYLFGELQYEGEYKNGKRWCGRGKYYNNENLVFQGEYRDGKINGKGKEFLNNELIFEG